MGDVLELFAACAPGLEPWLESEVRGIGIGEARAVPGGVEFTGTLDDCLRVNLAAGSATCVLLRVARFRCLRLPELRRKTANLAWDRWLAPGATCAVRARSRKSKLYHSGAIEQRVAAALVEHGHAAAGDGIGVHVRFERDECTLSLDTSGAPLHRRGWRLDAAKAPLREDLAWAVVLAASPGGGSPIVDPFAGSGTLAIEAAAHARGLAPNRLRSFALERLAPFDRDAGLRVRADFAAAAAARAPGPILAADRDAGAVAAIRANAERAGVAADVEVVHAPLESVVWPEATTGAVVTNPPHGRRIGDREALRDLYAALGRQVAARGWRLAVVTSSRELAAHTGHALAPVWTADHGGTRVHLLLSG